MSDFADRLASCVAGTPLQERFATAAAPFLELRADDAAGRHLDPAVLRGLARLLASEPRDSAFLSHRPAVLERLAAAGAGTLRARAQELAAAPYEPEDDLEAALDGLRLLRREETCLAACLDLGGLVSLEEACAFLSTLAEVIAGRAFTLAHRNLGRGGLREEAAPVSVIAMGKLAGREFTYHSDLDLIFLYTGGAEEYEEPWRLAQRTISYLNTMTGAGVAYAVDARLRPSGQQGALVTTLEGFERYQTEQAETWEHLALLRARPIAGDVARTEALLDRVRSRMRADREAPWPYLADLRGRVERERAPASADALAFKTGAGGLMDVDFLAGGALLERGDADLPALPSVPDMLRAAVRGPRVESLLDDYHQLRRLEARTRWCAGRAVEALDADEALRAVVAELVEPGLTPAQLLARTEAVRARVRAAWHAVTGAGSIQALLG